MTMICHGERSDTSNLEQERGRVENKYDCPLSYLGASQAHVTGQYLRMVLNANGYEKIIIESSPFLRTLETAAIIASELNINEV